jgi:putative transposase
MWKPDGTVRKTRQTVNEPGDAHELTFCCYRHLPLLSRRRTRLWFVEALDRARKTLDLELWAYVIMPEHAHVLLLPSRDDYQVAAILKAIKQPVAQRAIRFLREHSPAWLERLRIGSPRRRQEYRFWQQGGGYDRNINSAKTAWASVDYIHNNPVRRGLASNDEEWEWSSARWYAGHANVKLAMDASPPDLSPT